MKKKLLIVLVLMFVPLLALADTDHLVISQIQTTGGSGKTTNDFVEIYNPTAQDIDLNGYRLVKRSKDGVSDTSIKSWTGSAVIKAHGFYLWANSAFTDIASAADSATSGSIADDNSLAIRNGPADTGTIIDSAGWGAAANSLLEGSVFGTNPDANQSLERLPGADAGNGTDTNNNSVDFFLQPTAHPRNSLSPATPAIASTPPPPPPDPSPSPPPPSPPPPAPAPSPVSSGLPAPQTYSADIVISEFLPNPDGKDDGEEWIELFNKSGADVDLSGWMLDDEGSAGTVGSSAYKFPANSMIAASGYLVINLPPESFALNNTGGDSVRLFWPNKSMASSVAFTGNAKADEAYALNPAGAYSWTQLPTKGTANQFEAAPENGTKAEPKPNAVESSSKNPDAQTDPEVLPQKIDVVINEIFPEPLRKSSQEEFIELYNPGPEAADLSGFKLSDSASGYNLANSVIPPGGYMVILKSQTNISLNNSGKESVTLTDPKGLVISSLEYADAPAGQSYNLMPDATYAWSVKLTPGLENQIVHQAVIPKKSVSAVSHIAAKPILAPDIAEPSSEIFPDQPGTVSAASIENSIANNSPDRSINWLPVWLVIGSFALNLLFCYILVKIMLRSKTKVTNTNSNNTLL
ncbi:MAG: lamin tail domain-containing protein [Candidatus Doudnabacteria bacterium]